MYIPNHFEVKEESEIHAFIKANAFGQLISTVDDRLFSTHLPVLLNDKGDHLLCHLARANPQWKQIDNQEVLVTLQGSHDYISPSWYNSPGVPTWNYQAVHIYGKCRVIEEADGLKQIVDTLTAKFEAAFDAPWQPDYAASMLRGIVGLEIAISEIQCKYKLNQNRSDEDQNRVIETLDAHGSQQLAKAMRENR